MELLKRTIHRNDVRQEGQLQTILEEDVNLPETKPDVGTICMERGRIVTEEVRPMTDAVTLRGKLVFSVLYHTQEYGGRLECLEGKIPFEEKIRMEGVTPSDEVFARGLVEDLTVTMINSRKLSVQSIVTLEAVSESVWDEEVPVDALPSDREDVQVRQVPMEYTEVCLCQTDAWRIREEITLPAGYATLSRILWKDVSLGEMNFRLGEEKLIIQGEVKVFVLYEGDDGEPVIYETVLEETSEIACPGCREGETLDVRYGLSQWELTPGEDEDGEMRRLGLDATTDLTICVYEEKQVDAVTDIYGVKQDYLEEKRKVGLRRLIRSVTGKTKVSGQITLEGGAKVTSLVHSEAQLGPVEVTPGEGGVNLRGSLCVKILYVTGDEEKPYGCMRKTLPFSYFLEIPGMTGEETPERVQAVTEQLGVSMMDGEEMDLKAILSFMVTVFQEDEAQVLSAVTELPADEEKMAALPGMAIHVVQPGEGLWDVGKRYYQPIHSLMEMNGLTDEEVLPGQKLLIVKGV